MSGRPLEDLVNLGRVSARQLAEVGITSEGELREVGALAAFARLRHRFGRAVTFNYLYALDGALKGVRWDFMAEKDRARLRSQAEKLIHSRPAAPRPSPAKDAD